ncbi:MAG: hypothetical protein BZY87_10450 [SAR202 cluster bacterium Io17-Chloro-G6]|nr:MAG: hypothetical protein BZY87_10450 [SAR202 cluster bacterium Io17-Chloro-G6]
MYGNQATIPSVRRPKKPSKNRSKTRFGKPVGLSRGLHQSLQKGLYQDLVQGFQTRDHEASIAPKIAQVAPEMAESSPTDAVETPGPGINIRKVGLLFGETVTHTFCPEKGLVPHPEEQGRMLVLTNQRVIAFGNREGTRETVLMPVDEVKAVSVNAGLRSKLMLLQGGLIMMAGVVIYVLLAYWLTGRIDGPTIPVIRMDLVAFLVFLAILSSVGMMSQFYFSKPDGEVAFQGDGVRLVFPFRGETAEDSIYQVVNATFAARQSILGYSDAEYIGQTAR